MSVIPSPLRAALTNLRGLLGMAAFTLNPLQLLLLALFQRRLNRSLALFEQLFASWQAGTLPQAALTPKPAETIPLAAHADLPRSRTAGQGRARTHARAPATRRAAAPIAQPDAAAPSAEKSPLHARQNLDFAPIKRATHGLVLPHLFFSSA
jgi:hypothetical protein